jgi:4-hydroxy-tetrahydrodipicolinate synthase
MIVDLKGIVTPLITPFKANEDIDVEGYKRNIDFQVENKVHGLVCLATAGESASLSFEEKKKLIDVAVDQTNDRIPLLIGTGGTEMRETMALTKYSEDAGADCIFLITPYFYKFTQNEIIDYMKTVANSVDLHVLIYNSTYAGCPLDPRAIKELCEVDNIKSLKEGNVLQMVEVIRETRGRLNVFTSRDTYLFDCLALGGAGAIAFAANVAPKMLVELYDNYLKNNIEKAREMQFKLLPLILKLVSRSYPAPLKAAMNMLGMAAGPPRAPLTPLSKEEMSGLKRELQSLALL